MKQKGELRVDSRGAFLGGGDSGPALVPGQPESSRVIQALRYGGDLRMPPKGKLADEKVGVLARWIKMGAPWPEAAGAVRTARAEQGITISEKDRAFWAFQPVKNVMPPPMQTVSSWWDEMSSIIGRNSLAFSGVPRTSIPWYPNLLRFPNILSRVFRSIRS